MRAAIICREFGWTWDEYMDQPQEFIDTITSMLNEETAAANAANRKSQQRPQNNNMR